MISKFLEFNRIKMFEASMPPRNGRVSFESAVKIILRWGSGEVKKKVIFNGDRQKIDHYLEAVDVIQESMELGTISDDLTKANNTIEIAMACLESEFRIILVSLTGPISTNSWIDSRSSTSATNSTTGYNDYTEYGAMSNEAIYYLRSIAERMNSAGHLHECVKTYESVRRAFLDKSFQRLGIEKLRIGDIRRLEWEALEMKIREWMRAAKVCVRILFPNEKRLCEQIFEGLGTATADTCFLEMVKDTAMQLFNFAKAISITRRSPELLFKILDLHNTLSDLLQDIDVLFQSKSSDSIRIQAAMILPQLAEAAREILSEFENAVLHDLSNVLDLRGRIHPLTTYVVNYITQISCYKKILTEFIVSQPRYSDDTIILDMEFAKLERQTPLLAVHLIWIIDILQFNLEGKSKHLEDAALAHFFMMNNIHIIVQKIKDVPELQEMIGSNYLKKLTDKFQQASTSYQISTWERVLYCFRDEGLHVSGIFSSGVSKCALKERFKTFNVMFEEVQSIQSTWLVPNKQLREELRLFVGGEVDSSLQVLSWAVREPYREWKAPRDIHQVLG